jgi:hypothetical protein
LVNGRYAAARRRFATPKTRGQLTPASQQEVEMVSAERTDPELRVLHFLEEEDRSIAVREAGEEAEIVSVATEILEQLGAIREQIARIEGADYGSRLVDHEARLRILEDAVRDIRTSKRARASTLEGWRLWALLACAGVGAVGALVSLVRLLGGA